MKLSIGTSSVKLLSEYVLCIGFVFRSISASLDQKINLEYKLQEVKPKYLLSTIKSPTFCLCGMYFIGVFSASIAEVAART